MKLTDLAAAADTTPRTIRYYISQGLLPPPDGSGPAAQYHEGHILRLQAIRQLQAQHLPLAEIRSRLEGEAPAPPPPAPDRGASALAYLDAVLTGGAAPPAPSRLPSASPAARSSWDRHHFGPDVEIHIRRPLTRDTARRVDQLLEEARRLFHKESP